MNTIIEKRYTQFRRISFVTLIAVYFLIFVGGVVRSTGSGMGCPDWPKCFGSWMPPTEESQLPENYQEIYSMKRHEKNSKLASYLSALGFGDTASKIINDSSIREEDKFNPTKTWTEYINRLVGASIGILIFLTALSSFKLWKANKKIVIYSTFTLLLIGFQGWIGSVVVSTKLLPWVVTTHMILALLIVALLTYLWYKGEGKNFTFKNNALTWILMLSLVALSVQITLGTQVREGVDLINRNEIYSGNWIELIGGVFYFHRSFSLLILGVNLWLVVKMFREIGSQNPNFILSRIISGLIVVEIATGAGMAYFSIPPFLQPIHLLLGTGLFGLSFLLFLNLSAEQAKTIVTNG